MSSTHPGTVNSRHISQVIKRPPAVVYDFAVDPENLPLWAAGLAQSKVVRDGDKYIVDAPMGRVAVQFVPRNVFGILDHDVTLPSGVVVNNPMRVLAHPSGSEVIFTVRQIDLTDDELDRDARLVAADLARLKTLLEES